MAQVINTNVSSLTAQRSLNRTQGQLARSLQRLSTGLRINSARDDAAGLAISERFTTQIRGLNQAIRNTNDGISLVQTAEAALAETSNNLQRIRELALQSVNASNTAEDRKSLNAEVQALVSEISRVADTTTFNGTKILDGNFSVQEFQVGAGVGETIAVTVRGARSNQLSNNTVAGSNTTINEGTGSARTATANLTAITGNVESQVLTFNTVDGAQTLSLSDNVSAADIASSVNNTSTGITGVRARATNSATFTVAQAGVLSFSLGSTGDATTVLSTNVSNAADLTGLTESINDISGTTGVSAVLSTDQATVTLTDSNGDDILIGDVVHTNSSGGITVSGVNDSSGVALGNLAAANSSSASFDSTVVTGTVTFNSADDFTVRSDTPDSSGGVFSVDAATLVASTEQTVSSVSVSTVANSNSALDIIDSALATVASIRSDLGALQNRFETTITNLETVSENASAARSRILDADFASETAALTRAQILQQAGISILSQSNLGPQSVLALLQ